MQFVSALNSQLLMKVCSFGKLLYVIVLYYILSPCLIFITDAFSEQRIEVDSEYMSTWILTQYRFSVGPIYSPNQIAVFWMSISWRQRIYWYMDILRCMDMFLITKILDLAYVQNYTRCLSHNKSTKLFRVYLSLSLAPLSLLIVKTVTHIL